MQIPMIERVDRPDSSAAWGPGSIGATVSAALCTGNAMGFPFCTTLILTPVFISATAWGSVAVKRFWTGSLRVSVTAVDSPATEGTARWYVAVTSVNAASGCTANNRRDVSANAMRLKRRATVGGMNPVTGVVFVAVAVVVVFVSVAVSVKFWI